MVSRAISILRWVAFSLCAGTLAVGLWQLWIITWWPFQHEFREGAMAATTYALRLGLNPFSLRHQPQFSNVYGPLYPTLAALFATDAQNSFIVARIVSSVAMLANSLTLGWWIYRVSSPLIAVGAVTFFLYQQLDASSGAFPMSLGTLLLVAPIAWIDVRGVTVKRVLGGGLLGALAFMTKPYFIVVSVIMGVVSLTSLSWRATILYGLLTGASFIGVLLCYAYLFPALWINTILHHMAVVRFDPQYRSEQVTFFVRQTWPLLCSFSVFLIALSLRYSRENLRSLTMIARDPAVLATCLTGALFYFKMSGHSGSALGHYLCHIFTPFFLVVWSKALWGLCRSMEGEASRLMPILGGVVVSGAVFLSHAWNRPVTLTSEERGAWELVRLYVRESSLVLADPPSVSLLMENKVPIVDSGQSEFFLTGGATPEMIRWAVPDYSDKATSKVNALATRISRAVRQGKYDTLIATQGYPQFLDIPNYATLYERCTDAELAMPLSSQRWTVRIYRRRGECRHG
ncbi:MAG: hypothetical protein RL326_2016 [Pseudomonadota bacterium]|jgi:hypothetical protein